VGLSKLFFWRKSTPSDVKVSFVDHSELEDDRYMNLAVAKHNWQTAFRITMALLALSVGFNGYYMTQSKFIPVPIPIDHMGNYIVVGPVTDAHPIDDERVILHEIGDFIELSRSVVGDNLYQKKRMRWVEHRILSGSAAAKIVDELYTMRPPFATAEHFTYEVEIKSKLRQSKNMFMVEWIEIQRNLAGEIVNTEHWKALLTYKLIPQTTYEEIENNPLGFFVTELSWSKVN
jgi:type IV secretory pathway TrbF-like protein